MISQLSLPHMAETEINDKKTKTKNWSAQSHKVGEISPEGLIMVLQYNNIDWNKAVTNHWKVTCANVM